MSFRSRSRNVQPVIQRRSLSGSRLPNTISTYTNNRPLSSAYPNSVSYTTSNYVSPYTSRDGIYGSNGTRNNYYNAGHTSRRDSYTGSSTVYKNPYTSDRYISPYTSFDNGITTAGLSIKSSSGYSSTNGYSSKSTYTPSSSLNSMSSVFINKPLNRHTSNLKSTSNTSLNTFSLTQANVAIDKSKKLGRSQSYRDPVYEHRSRSLRRNSSLKSDRSLSVSSEKSEGYEVRLLLACFQSLFLSLSQSSYLQLHILSLNSSNKRERN